MDLPASAPLHTPASASTSDGGASGGAARSQDTGNEEPSGRSYCVEGEANGSAPHAQGLVIKEQCGSAEGVPGLSPLPGQACDGARLGATATRGEDACEGLGLRVGVPRWLPRAGPGWGLAQAVDRVRGSPLGALLGPPGGVPGAAGMRASVLLAAAAWARAAFKGCQDPITSIRANPGPDASGSPGSALAAAPNPGAMPANLAAGSAAPSQAAAPSLSAAAAEAQGGSPDTHTLQPRPVARGKEDPAQPASASPRQSGAALHRPSATLADGQDDLEVLPPLRSTCAVALLGRSGAKAAPAAGARVHKVGGAVRWHVEPSFALLARCGGGHSVADPGPDPGMDPGSSAVPGDLRAAGMSGPFIPSVGPSESFVEGDGDHAARGAQAPRAEQSTQEGANPFPNPTSISSPGAGTQALAAVLSTERLSPLDAGESDVAGSTGGGGCGSGRASGGHACDARRRVPYGQGYQRKFGVRGIDAGGAQLHDLCASPSPSARVPACGWSPMPRILLLGKTPLSPASGAAVATLHAVRLYDADLARASMYLRVLDKYSEKVSLLMI